MPVDAEEIRKLPSPDGRRTALVVQRAQGGDTILIASDGVERDVLPANTSLSTTRRGYIELAVWLTNRELIFEHSCGTGCLAFHKLDVDTGKVSHIWTGTVDCCVHWSPRKDRVIVGTSMGGLAMIHVNGKVSVLSGCKLSDTDGYQGTWYAFERWLDSGDRAYITRVGCDKFCHAPSATKGAPTLIWDGSVLVEGR